MSEQEIWANDLVQYVGPDPDMYATYGRVHTVHTHGLSGPVADTLFDGQTGMDAVPVKFLHKVPANTAPDAPQDHGPLAAHLSDRTLDKVLSRPAYVPPSPTKDAIVEAAIRWYEIRNAHAADVTPLQLFDADDALNMAVKAHHAAVTS